MLTVWKALLAGSCVAWILLWFARLRFWCPPLHRPSGNALSWDLCAIVPARNEARHVNRLVESLRAQTAIDMPVLFVDDHSDDETLCLATSAAAEIEGVRVLSSPPKPADWAGKTWAAHHGASASTSEWILFCDADTTLSPDAMIAAKELIDREQLDALSIIPRMKSSRLSVASLLAIFAVARAILLRPASPTRRGLMQGAVLAVRRSVYEAVGGFAAQKGSLLEDVDLGHAIQKAGYRLRTLPPSRLAATEMYSNFGEAWEGIQKLIYPVMGRRVTRILAGALVCMVLIALPPFSWIAGATVNAYAPSPDLFFVTGLSLLATVLAAWFATRILARESLSILSWCLLPLSFFLFCGLAVSSILAYRQGRVCWKGRTYAPRWTPEDVLPSTPLRRTP